MKLTSEIRQHFGYKVEEHDDYLTVWLDVEGRTVESEEIRDLLEMLGPMKDVKWVRLSRPERIILNSEGSRIGLVLYIFLMGKTLWTCPGCGAKRKLRSSRNTQRCPVCHSMQMIRSGAIMQRTSDLQNLHCPECGLKVPLQEGLVLCPVGCGREPQDRPMIVPPNSKKLVDDMLEKLSKKVIVEKIWKQGNSRAISDVSKNVGTL